MGETTFCHLDPTLESYLVSGCALDQVTISSWVSVSESGSFQPMMEIDILIKRLEHARDLGKFFRTTYIEKS